ncbi:hypothetical protein ABW21_db0207770 [Orbilia brochopaga]|nr:hypothetical protein ABW21_db0207770 [Drechslerella brochopaga]
MFVLDGVVVNDSWRDWSIGRRVARRPRGVASIAESGGDWNLAVEDLRWELEHVGDRDIGRGAGLAQWRAVQRAGGGESRAVDDPVAEFWNGDSLGWVDFEDATKNQVQLCRQRKDGSQETGILEEGTEGAVALRCTLPRVPSTCQVDQNHTQRPDIVWRRSVAGRSPRWRLLAFWRHIESRTAAKVRGDGLCGSETEVCKLDLGAILGDQHVFRFQVPVIDTHGVAVLDGVQQLQEDSPRQHVVPHIVAVLGDVCEQVTFGAVLDNDICAVDGMQDLDQVDHVRVCAGTVVQGDFPLLEPALPGVEADLGQRLDGIGDVGVDVDCGVDDTVCADAEDAGELDAASQQMPYPFFRASDEGNLGVQRKVRHVCGVVLWRSVAGE